MGWVTAMRRGLPERTRRHLTRSSTRHARLGDQRDGTRTATSDMTMSTGNTLASTRPASHMEPMTRDCVEESRRVGGGVDRSKWSEITCVHRSSRTNTVGYIDAKSTYRTGSSTPRIGTRSARRSRRSSSTPGPRRPRGWSAPSAACPEAKVKSHAAAGGGDPVWGRPRAYRGRSSVPSGLNRTTVGCSETWSAHRAPRRCPSGARPRTPWRPHRAPANDR